MSLLLSTLGCGAVVIFAGIILGRSANVIAETTGLGRVWTGAVLLAMATSLPELVTDVSAVRLHVPDLAAGDLFGSSLANMFILGVVALFAAGQTVPKPLAPSNVLTIWMAIVLSCLGALFVLFPSVGAFHGLRPESTLLLLIYLAGLRTIIDAHRRMRQVRTRRSRRLSPRADNGTAWFVRRSSLPLGPP